MRSIIALLLLLLVTSCSEKKTGRDYKVVKVPKPSELVLIFKSPPVNNRYKFENGFSTSNGGLHEITYIDDNLLEQLLPLNYERGGDTIAIQTKRDIVEFQHTYQALDKLSFFLKAGDSVLITYNGFKPVVTIINRNVSQYDTNFEIAKREVILHDHLPASVKPITFEFKTNDYLGEMRKAFELNKIELRAQCKMSLKFLDSIHVNKKISSGIYELYKNKELWESKVMNANNINFLFVNEPLNLSTAKASMNELLDTQNDTLLYYSYYRDALNKVLLIETRKVKRIRTNNSNLPDYKSVYDTLVNNKLIRGKSKEYLLLKTLELIIITSSIEQIHNYLEKFEKTVSNKSYVKYLKTTYKLNFDGNSNLELKTVLNERISFQDVLKKNEGRVVYVDFWATWCGPCVKSIPDSKKLYELYKNKGVVFVYLSKDENYDVWKKGLIKYGLLNTESYLIDNLYTSKLLEDLNVSSIPRYLLFDRKGNLVHQNAPHPDGEEIKLLLDKYLKM